MTKEQRSFIIGIEIHNMFDNIQSDNGNRLLLHRVDGEQNGIVWLQEQPNGSTIGDT